MKRSLYLFLLIFWAGSIQAQNKQHTLSSDGNAVITNTQEGISKFSLNHPLSADSVFLKYGKQLGLLLQSEMKQTKVNKDEMGYLHEKYQQFYQGYAIAGAEYIIHSKNEIALTGNGNIVQLKNALPLIGFDKKSAIAKAMNYFKADKYAWQIPQLENDKKEREQNNAATWYPSPTLEWVATENTPNETYQLAYVIDLCNQNLSAKKLFIDARTGLLIKEIQLNKNCTSAMVNTNFNGPQNIFTFFDALTGYSLWDQCQGAFIRVRQWVNPISNATEIFSANNTWASAQSAATSLWTVKKAYEYFMGVHARNGWNGAGAGVNVYQNALFCYSNGCTPNDANNASFLSGTLQVGNSGTATTIDDWNTLDISAHEFAHGVTESSANLTYANESGALNESFSDIFGASCYQWFNPSKDSVWYVGLDRRFQNNLSAYIRNMTNPSQRSQPDTYLGALWYVGSFDNGGVHINSGVQNYMYYLLVSGGAGTNDNGVSFQVTGIGFEKARRIAYHTLTNYLISSSNYQAARNAWVRAAAQLYGECSFEAIQTGRAWQAVGLEPPVTTIHYFCADFGATTYNNYKLGPIHISNGCISTITATGNLVRFTSGTKVTMGPGFTSLTGSRFNAAVNECGFAYYE